MSGWRVECVLRESVPIADEIYSEKFKEALQMRRKVYEERMASLKDKLHL